MIKQINFGDQPVNVTNDSSNEAITHKNTVGFDLSINAVFILIQTVCSCLAGVYNEYLLKDKGENINIYVQNVFMYLDSIFCNALILLLQGNLIGAFSFDNLTEIVKPSVLIVMFINCAIGITTSFFLKYMNSIIKTFASALELVFTAVLCRILFAIPVYLNTVASIAIVFFSLFLYSQSPVVNLSKTNNMVRSSIIISFDVILKIIFSLKNKQRDLKDMKALLADDDDEEDLLRMEEVIVKNS
jgi:integrin beta 8